MIPSSFEMITRTILPSTQPSAATTSLEGWVFIETKEILDVRQFLSPLCSGMNAQISRTLSSAEKLAWLRLIRSDNIGPITFHRLMERFGSAEAALSAVPGMAKRGGGKAIKLCTKAAAERELKALDDIGAGLVALCEPDYPPLLAQIDDAPPVLSVRGHTHLLKKRALAIVGARNASINGRTFAQRLAGDLGRAGVLVVSGFARGIDAAAHEGALETGTVAVMAGGIDVIYPKENATLYDQILERGAMVSEIAPGTQPQARHFPRRNRLVSGMSRGVAVIEAGRKSGSLITARMALEQGREVFAVPGSPQDPRAGGANDLIRQGAVLTENAADIMENLKNLAPPALRERKGIDFKEEIVPPPADDILAEARETVLQALGPSPVTVDEIIRGCQLSHATVAWVLLELELGGRIERHPGNAVSLLYA